MDETEPKQRIECSVFAIQVLLCFVSCCECDGQYQQQVTRRVPSGHWLEYWHRRRRRRLTQNKTGKKSTGFKTFVSDDNLQTIWWEACTHFDSSTTENSVLNGIERPAEKEQQAQTTNDRAGKIAGDSSRV